MNAPTCHLRIPSLGFLQNTRSLWLFRTMRKNHKPTLVTTETKPMTFSLLGQWTVGSTPAVTMVVDWTKRLAVVCLIYTRTCRLLSISQHCWHSATHKHTGSIWRQYTFDMEWHYLKMTAMMHTHTSHGQIVYLVCVCLAHSKAPITHEPKTIQTRNLHWYDVPGELL